MATTRVHNLEVFALHEPDRILALSATPSGGEGGRRPGEVEFFPTYETRRTPFPLVNW